jgi:MATE family multidrug resistance protein
VFVGQLVGAGRVESAGEEVHQATWLALASSVLGCALLLFPQPFLWLAKAGPEVAERVQGYLRALSVALPASVLFTVLRSFNSAVSRPKPVMLLQLGGLALKLPLTAALVFGVPALGIAEFGVTGTGLATALGLVVYAGRAPLVGLYTGEAEVAAAALPLLAWLVVFHLADALQTIAAFVLRAWRVATLPMFIYAGSLWGIGPVGGYTLAFDLLGIAPPALRGATGFWVAATVGRVAPGTALTALMRLALAPAPRPGG